MDLLQFAKAACRMASNFDRAFLNQTGRQSAAASAGAEQSPLLENSDSITSSGQRVSAVRTSQQSHHFIKRGNVELWHRAGVLQSVLHRFGGIE